MWLACLKYHPTYGIPGTGIRGDTLQEQMIDLGRGWEWWPTVLWQVIWTWIVSLRSLILMSHVLTQLGGAHPPLASLGHPRYHGMAYSNHWLLPL